MAALTADSDRASKGAGRIIEWPLAKEVEEFYKGAIIMADASGYAVVGSDATNGEFLGIAVEGVSITTEDTTDGDTKIRLYTEGIFLFAHETGDAAITSHGEIMCIWTDNAVDDLTKCSTGGVECGEIMQWKDADEVWLCIDNYSCGRVRVAAA